MCSSPLYSHCSQITDYTSEIVVFSLNNLYTVIFFFQVCASRLDPDYFISSVFERCGSDTSTVLSALPPRLAYLFFLLLLNMNHVLCITSLVNKRVHVNYFVRHTPFQLSVFLCLHVRFKVVDLLTMASQHQNAVLDAEQERPMLEGALTFLVILCSLRIHLGWY